MRIRRISLTNLNSLRGEHSVDLADEPFASAGLFAITGPTGAGKTTLLDAITLALYGRAARYGAEPNPEDMMSRHTGECRAEVEFEVAGQVYRAEWHLHRARGAADGKVQPAKRYLYDAAGEPLTQKLRETDEKIEALCGLDYDRFMRSVLLAQGEFARFLKARPDERAALLESLTGTGLYSELSALAHEEHARRERELGERERELGLHQPLSDEEREKLAADAETAKARLTKAQADQKARAETLGDAKDLAEAIKAEAKLLTAQKELATNRKKRAPQLATLTRHRTAAAFFPALEKVETASKHHRENTERAHSADAAAAKAKLEQSAAFGAALAVGRKQIAETEKLLDGARERIGVADKTRADTASWLEQHEADSALKDALPNIAGTLSELAAAKRSGGKLRAQLESQRRDQAEAKNLLTSAKKVLEDAEKEAEKQAAAEASLAENLSTANAEKDLAKRRSELESLRTLIAKQDALASERKAAHDHKRSIAKEREALPDAKTAKGTSQRALTDAERQLELLNRHLADARLFASFEEQRTALEDGDECPLCGATDHPFCKGDAEPTAPAKLEAELAAAKSKRDRCKGDADSASKALTGLEARLAEAEKTAAQHATRITAQEAEATELADELGLADRVTELAKLEADQRGSLSKVEALEKQTNTAQAAAAAASAKRNQRATEAKAAAARLAELEKTIANTQAAIESTQTELAKSSAALESQLSPFGPKVPESGSEEALRAQLKERATAFTSAEKKLANAEKLLAAAQSDEKSSSKSLVSLRSQSATAEKNAGDSEPPATPTFQTIEQALERARACELEAQTQTATATERARAVAEAKAALDAARSALADALDGADFADTEALRSARLSPEALAETEQLDRDLSDREQRTAGALERQRSILNGLREKSPPEGEAFALLRAESQRADEEIAKLTDSGAELRAKLKSDDALRERRETAAKQLADERDQLKVWAQLAALIGSHDGKKFRVFAQGLSLDLLLHHANVHLARLEPRYLLARHAEGELEIEIIDTHQASTVRPMNSLSGGESFLASLALALGLSDLAGRNVQIDSLFIDEGFGTLDTSTLDTALSALEALRAQDKTIGVISHVEMLKERIGVRIAVERAADGSSKLRIADA